MDWMDFAVDGYGTHGSYCHPYLKVKTSNSNMFGSVSKNKFSSPKAIMVEATIPSF